jgi:deoxyribose-phosphate aldolase
VLFRSKSSFEIITINNQTNTMQVGFKPAGGVSTPAQALAYRELVRTVLGNDWLHPHLFRIGASSLLDSIEKELA